MEGQGELKDLGVGDSAEVVQPERDGGHGSEGGALDDGLAGSELSHPDGLQQGPNSDMNMPADTRYVISAGLSLKPAG
jgi:hypothetical protein